MLKVLILIYHYPFFFSDNKFLIIDENKLFAMPKNFYILNLHLIARKIFKHRGHVQDKANTIKRSNANRKKCPPD